MSDVLDLATPRRAARATQQSAWRDGGTLTLYSAPRPDTADAPVPETAVRLAVLDYADPSGTVAGRVWTATLPAAQPGLAAGLALWARERDAAGETIADASVGGPGSGAAVQLSTTTIVPGLMVIPTAVAISEG